MEIKRVESEVTNCYPKLKQYSKSKVSKSISQKWIKLGMTTVGMSLAMKNSSYAISPSELKLPGDVVATQMVPLPARICKTVCPITSIVLAIIFLITGLSMIMIKIKSKKQSDSKKIKTWQIVLLITSAILLVASIVCGYIVKIEYY